MAKKPRARGDLIDYPWVCFLKLTRTIRNIRFGTVLPAGRGRNCDLLLFCNGVEVAEIRTVTTSNTQPTNGESNVRYYDTDDMTAIQIGTLFVSDNTYTGSRH